MDFPDLDDFFDPDLYLRYRGKVYRVPCEGAHDALRLRQILASGPMTMAQERVEALKLLGATWESHTEQKPVFDDASGVQKVDDDGEPVTREITVGEWVGGVYQQMADDGASIEVIMHAGMTALNKAINGRDEAMEYWSTALTGPRDADAGDQGKAPTPNKAPAKKSAAKKATKTARTSSRASTAKKSTTGAQARTAKTTRAAATTTR